MILSAQPRQSSDSDPVVAAQRQALRLLAGREHSRLELERKLASRGFDASAIGEALVRLEREGALDESRLAERYVEERIDKGFGPLRIRSELRNKGVDDALIDRCLQGSSETWEARLAAVCDRRFGAEPPEDRADVARRARFLAQRGFPTESIRRLLRWND
ncbi:regulatory protein RecX [Imhoffiella purpurea]|uniref:Regulatory protein RecX n=1 Tax=Imhoffiella purpurea TaxID=1249627 RepID=W9V9Q1_9GAMM|nr:regulatory protein RecX [Imhoffiella purpurea]EXJ16303.1 Regulatory protein RecX [Imhoffiella purpurea]